MSQRLLSTIVATETGLTGLTKIFLILANLGKLETQAGENSEGCTVCKTIFPLVSVMIETS